MFNVCMWDVLSLTGVVQVFMVRRLELGQSCVLSSHRATLTSIDA